MRHSTSNSTNNEQGDDAAVDDDDVDLERQAEDDTDVRRDDGNLNRLHGQRMFGWSARPQSNRESFLSKKAKKKKQKTKKMTATTHGVDSPVQLARPYSAPCSSLILFRKQVTALRLQAIDLLFGLSADHALEWSGMLVFCHHLESCFEELLHPRFDIIWKIIRRGLPSTTTDGWYWCFAVIKIFQTLQDDDASIEKAYQRLIENAEDDIAPHEKIQVLRAMFAALCWTSATLKPLLNEEAIAVAINTTNPGMLQSSPSSCSSSLSFLAAENSSQKYSSKDLRRPISKLIYSFQNHSEDVDHSVSDGPPSNGGSSDNDVLYESSLNYFSLFTIGRVRMRWVDTLTAHLAFDRSTRTLSIFCFPSFCVANVLCKHDVKVLKSITAKLLPSRYRGDLPHEPSDLHREVLLSYRLLFGQSSSSRKLLDQLLRQSASAAAAATHSHRLTNHDHHHHHHRLDSSPSSSDIIMNDIDPFLSTICTSPLLSRWRRKRTSRLLSDAIFPFSALDLNNQLQESDTYSTRDDFPVFGSRLLTLQHYNMRQQPSKVKDLWRDRRNPLQWYTFWAVLLIGGASIVLALLQLLVGLAQVYLAARPVVE